MDLELFALGVNPSRRCQGIGSALIKRCVNTLQKNSFVSIKTTVFADNLKMQRMLLKHEFYPVSMEHGKRYDGMAVINYMKQLRRSGR
jgi:ribosomal protein S18 acetylase RimI-like enzyme